MSLQARCSSALGVTRLSQGHPGILTRKTCIRLERFQLDKLVPGEQSAHLGAPPHLGQLVVGYRFSACRSLYAYCAYQSAFLRAGLPAACAHIRQCQR